MRTEHDLDPTDIDEDNVERPLWHGRVALILSILAVASFVTLRSIFADSTAASDAVVAGDTNLVLLATFGMGLSMVFSTCAIILAIVSFTHGKIRPSAVIAMVLALASSLIALLFTMGG